MREPHLTGWDVLKMCAFGLLWVALAMWMIAGMGRRPG